MDEKLSNQYLDTAEKLGVNTTDPRDARDLLACLDYCLVAFSDRRLPDAAIADKIGVSYDQLLRLKSSRFIKIATQIVLSDSLADKSRTDVRASLFQAYQDYLPKATVNIARIAAGDTFTSVSGKDIKPPFRDQVSAYNTMITNPLASAWLSATFLGESGQLEETKHLDMRTKLLEKSKILSLDEDVIDAEVTITEDR